ncbi:hypothetical protein PHIN3_363 [Sinorhizobium phage phiN3]|uniref:Uncharacterized protein n=1 Tax=Sinorhizobium phage phiN3 TaxID=1647405 RepID=A0A0F6WCZ8_9CAUD|nr:virion structural protein [Sinorhizobium phage phiN3]AKF13626.1 hypothetical protein PHIN3_363 [Sinorhizobium phage phiN3]
MPAKTIAALVIVGGIAAVGFLSYSSAYNKGNRLENGITAQYEQNQNKLSQLSNSVMEAAQVPEMAKEDLKEVIESAMSGRYGNDKNLLFKSVTEAYPGQIDPKLYTRIQDLIESGRRDFASEQTMLIDKVRVYKTELGTLWGGMWMSVAGYPKINLDDYKIIISDYTADAFKTKRDKGLKLN